LGSDWGAIGERLERAIGTNERKRQIIVFIANNGESTSAMLAEFIGIKQGRIRKILKELAESGAIQKVGNYRYTSYGLKNNDN
jgi:predicted HTH transcriptional regulator